MKELNWIVRNWDKIPNGFKTLLKPEGHKRDISNLSPDEHIVVLVLDRQKPSIEFNYDFDEERIGITQKGTIVWGFDSGCSCPIPWNDHYPNCYRISKTWKEFEININDFDKNWAQDIIKMVTAIKKAVKSK